MFTKAKKFMTSYTGGRTPSADRQAIFGVLVLVALAFPGFASAQSVGRIVGRITEDNGAPVAGAQVVLDDGQNGTLTNDAGSFAMPNVTPGRHALRVERIGFATQDLQVDVVPGATATVDVEMETEVLALDGLTVIGSREEMEITRRQIREVPGGVALLMPAALRQTRQANFGDLLRFTPGVFAQPRYGAADETQFSIRGSGLRNNFHLRGVNILVNSMPYRLADGFTDFETLEMLNTESVQVYKGANALRFGGSTLGGAVNFESKTGHTAQPIEAYAQSGSFGFFKGQLASGNVFGDFNYYASYTRTDVGGFRDYSGQVRDRVNVHLGQRLSEDVDLRGFYWFANVQEDLPGSLSQTDIATDRRAANASNVTNLWGRDYKLHHAGLQLRTQLGASTQLDVAPYFQHRDIVHPIFRVLDQTSDDWGTEVRLQDERQVGARDSRFTLGLQWARGNNLNRHYANVGGQSGALAKDQNEVATTIAIYAEEVLGLSDRLKAVVGARWARDGRELDDRFLNDGDQTDTRHYEAFQPKVGLLYDLPAVSVQLFANASRMYEPPLMIEVNSFAVPGFIDLEPQNAWQFEIGTRGGTGSLQWDVSIYDLEIDNEIININVQPFPNAPFTVPTYRNAEETRHYGVEAALENEFGNGTFVARDRLTGRVSYTWGLFEYVTDASFAGNRLPGTPEHYLTAEFAYSHPSGLALKPNVEWAPGSYFVDSANTVEKDGWVTFGARLDWAVVSWDGSIFVEARNLTNEHYSPAVAVDDSSGRFFYPADGRSFYAGFRWQPGS
jgi:iron complex outermembrane receptor protein